MRDGRLCQWTREAPAFAGALLDPSVDTPDFLTSTASGNDPLRFAVYRNNVTVGLVRAMEANFPAIVRLLGSTFFSAVAAEFVRLHPPRTRLLFEYGDQFAPFLESFVPLRDYPYLSDVARVEQAWREAFHESDAVALVLNDLASVQPHQVECIRFRAHPAARLVSSRFAAGSIYVANRQQQGDVRIDPAKSEWVLVTRPHLDCVVRILTPAQGIFAQSLLTGATLEAAIRAAMESEEGFDLSAAIAGIVNSGAFAGYTIRKKPTGDPI